MLVEELLEHIVGDDHVSRHFFRFLQYIQKLPRLKMYVATIDGEPTITDVNAFIENLKKYIARNEITAKKIVEGVEALGLND